MKFIYKIGLKMFLGAFLALPMFAYSYNATQPVYPNSDCSNDCVYTDAIYDVDDGGYEYYRQNQVWNNVKVPVVGILSGIVGGLIGASILDNDGPQGPQGPPGPGFVADSGQTLSFTLTALFPATPPGSVTATPFVTAPNGVTIEGPTITTPTGGGTIVFAPIDFNNPVFGFYNFGLSLGNTSATTLAGITLNGTIVNATRDGSTTNELTPLAGVSIAPGESQISSTFTYDPNNVP